MTAVRVGVGIAVLNDEGEILLGLRKGSHGEGEWAMPGGNVDPGETPHKAAQRELLEECAYSTRIGETLLPIPVWTYDDYLDTHEKHYACVYFEALVGGVPPVNCEPDRCEGWEFFDPENLPTPLFGGAQKVCDYLIAREREAQRRLAAWRKAMCICGSGGYPEPCPVHDPGRVGE